MGQRPQPVAIHGGGLVVHLRGRRLHPRGQAPVQVGIPPGQEIARLVHQGGIGGRVDAADAGGGAALDLVLQAGAGPGGEIAIAAAAQGKDTGQGRQRAVHRAGGRKGAEIIALHGLGTAILGDPRKVMVVADQDVGEGLVVPQDDIVVRLQALDQVRLEQQRLGLGMGGDDLERPGRLDHPHDAGGQPRRLGVGADPVAQDPSLADIEHLGVDAQHPVDAGALRQAPRHPLQEGEAVLALAPFDGRFGHDRAIRARRPAGRSPGGLAGRTVRAVGGGAGCILCHRAGNVGMAGRAVNMRRAQTAFPKGNRGLRHSPVMADRACGTVTRHPAAGLSWN